MTALTYALAAYAVNDDLTVSGMVDHGGQRVTVDMSDDYQQLIRELGTMVSNKPLYPTKTLGASGFDLSFSNTFAFISQTGADGGPGPWQRADVDEDIANSYLFVPQVSARKGLPLSMELGASGGWIGVSHQGVFGGWGRIGLIEGYKPYPDISLHFGYAGFVGNDEIELGAADAGVTFGSGFAFGSFPGINNAVFQPLLDASIVRIAAYPSISDSVAQATGALPIGASRHDNSLPAIWQPQFSGGFQLVNGTVLFRAIGSYAPGSIASLTLGMGWQY